MLGHDFRGAALYHSKFCSSPKKIGHFTEGLTSQTYQVRVTQLADSPSFWICPAHTAEPFNPVTVRQNIRFEGDSDLHMKHEVG